MAPLGAIAVPCVIGSGEIPQLDEEPDPVRMRLMSAPVMVDLEKFAACWLETNLVWRLKGGAERAKDPSFAGRLRGAFGAKLLADASRRASRRDVDTSDSSCAFDILFRNHGRMEPGFNLPSPWVIEADACGGDLVIGLRLFGFACDHADAAGDAMTTALQTKSVGSNVVLDHERTLRRGLPDGIPDGPLGLRFCTPVLLSSTDVTAYPRSLLTTLVARIGGLARWHDLTLALDRARLASLADSLAFRWVEPRPVRWRRRSFRQRKVIPMSGTLGTLTISASADALAFASLMLRFGSRCHLGADVAYGCGRFIFCQEAVSFFRGTRFKPGLRPIGSPAASSGSRPAPFVPA
jgi:CRISPR-associated endoribonuclease Cas6